MTDEELLKYLFYKKHIYSFNELYKKAKEAHPAIKKNYIKEWFENQQSIQLTNKPTKDKNEYLPIYSEVSYAFQLDLTFFPRYTKKNYGYEVLFTAINVNTRYAYAYPCKTKEIQFILEALKKMQDKTIIDSITCDSGSEFTNKKFKRYCRDNDITLYYVKDDSHKLGIINRFHRTLKEKLTQYFIAHNTVNWYDSVDKIVNNINHSVNRGIGYAPVEVNNFLEQLIIKKKKEKTNALISKIKLIINVGDKCRILKKVNHFDDKMLPKYSKKIYEIIKVTKNSVIVKDNKDKEYKAKKADIKIINEVEHNEFDEQEHINKEHRQDRIRKKLDVQAENIIVGRRNRKRKTIIDV